MKAFIWRIIIAAICYVLFWLVFPLFLEVIGINIGGAMMQLMRICSAAIAILYVVFGPVPPYPW
jgi:hypothetical protein